MPSAQPAVAVVPFRVPQRGAALPPARRAWTAALLVVVAAWSWPATGLAQGPAAPANGTFIVEQALEKPVNVTLPPDTRLEDALRMTLSGTGVKVSFNPATLGYLPDGLSTMVSGTLKGVKLRDALAALLNPLGLTWQTRSEDVLVVPTPLLERMARRLSWRETQTLGVLARNLWDTPAVQQLRRKYDTAEEPLPASRFSAAITDTPGRNAAEQLEEACAKLGWVWRLSDDTILLTSKAVQYQRNLDLTPVTLRVENQDVATVIADLARQAGVPLKSEPGVYLQLPDAVRKRMSISAPNASVQTVLDRISGASGLKFTVTNEGLVVSAGPTLGRPGTPGAGEGAGPPSEILGKIVIPLADGKFFEMIVRKSDLSPAAAEQVAKIKKDAVQKLEAELLGGSRGATVPVSGPLDSKP